MRQKVCERLVARADNPDMVFLTGDLGFMALEPLRDRLGERFINCGIAEQNMISVAAAMAKEGLEVWVYSIAPFCYARGFEQVRNDVCLHNLPVRLLGNGGGYGYGVMGATHHAIEDYGVLLTLPDMHVYTPAYNDDIASVIASAGDRCGPSYIRLGRDERKDKTTAPDYAPWRNIRAGNGPVVITLGPLASSVLTELDDMGETDPDLWLVSELPLVSNEIPEALAKRIADAGRLCVIEEHVSHGGLGSMMCQSLAEKGIGLQKFRHLRARGYPSALSGSQEYMRAQSELDPTSIRSAVEALT
ncbi:MAG: transketolase [Bradyrhizobium sp.]|nr:transketolase [Bradyrhizobium sp.]